MAYDRFDPRNNREGGRYGRDHGPQSRGRWTDEDSGRWREQGGRDEDRGWFERAGDQIASWFGDEDDRGRGSDRGWGREQHGGGGRRDPMSSRHEPWGDSQFDRGHDRERHQGMSAQQERGYRPMAGDYGRSEGMFGRSGESGGFGGVRIEERQRSQGFGGGFRQHEQQQGMHDPHYHNWRQRQMQELDRDYDEYRRENQSRFESEFESWRERRQQKRSMLGTVREHMEVVGNDEQPVGTVDRVAGDRIILTKSDPEAGGSHHSISCGSIDRIEANRVILDCSGDQATQSWRDEDRSRSLNEREDQGEVGPHMLNRSFEGTYR